MPELAEVEYFRKRWNPGLNQKVKRVLLHPKAAVFRGSDPALIEEKLTGATLLSSAAAAKQLLFRFSGDLWLGLHMGMTGELTAQPADYEPRKADHLVLVQAKQSLVFSDFRMFGRVQFHVGPKEPVWWTSIAPAILSDEFTVSAVETFLKRRGRTPIKAVLLMQERFPGIGNWMADEILWRAEIHPKKLAAALTMPEIKALHKQCRWVCANALKIVGENFGDLPKSWLFPHRWEDGGKCPKTGVPLVREEVGGRTTCWSPALQKL
ncbi:MAG TPA: DNA-formamidopyrimidine glycosylase family protein [Opitutaceae bacterium]|nr:DNA-formamidopyrimidine glycosylase family protein [Opitutaceae bacterium]